MGGSGWGEWGESARQGSVRRDCPGGRDGGSTFVTAAVPRDVRIDPSEKKSKRDELRRMGQRSFGGRGRGSRWHSRSTFYSGNAAAKFAKICGF